MTTTNPIDTGFAPWSLMTPDPGVSKRETTPTIQEARLHHRDGETHRANPDNGYMFGDDGFSFGDFLDVVNPLHHLPVVGAIYRSLTGDEIDPGAEMAGGALYGGPIGLASGVVNAMIEEHSGDDLGGHAMAFLFGDDDSGDTLASDADPVDLASLPPAGNTAGPLDLDSLSGLTAANANAGTVTAQPFPSMKYNASSDGAIANVDMASALFAANGNVTAAANVAAFNQGAFRRSDLAAAPQSGSEQVASQSSTGTAGPTRISQRMADHLAKLAGQNLSPVLPETTTTPAALPQPAPKTISGPLPEAFTAGAPEGNPFASAPIAQAPVTQTAALPLTQEAAAEPVRADQLQAAISQSGTSAVGYENPNDIARAMMSAIERYEQQRAKLQG